MNENERDKAVTPVVTFTPVAEGQPVWAPAFAEFQKGLAAKIEKAICLPANLLLKDYDDASEMKWREGAAVNFERIGVPGYVVENGTAAVGELVPFDGNPNTMTPADMEKLRRSIREFGFVDPIIARKEDKRIIGGHQRLEAAKLEKFQLVPVRWIIGIDDDHAKALTVALNKITGSMDDQKLAVLLMELSGGIDATLTGYDRDEIAKLLACVEVSPALTDPDDVPELPKETDTRRGDLWVMDGHRLLCGDSTIAAEVDAVMRGNDGAVCFAKLCVTDPPWNVAYGDGKDGKGGRIAPVNWV